MTCCTRSKLFTSGPFSLNHGAKSPIGDAHTSTNVLPPTCTARACAFSLWPPHDPHVLLKLHPPRPRRRLLETAQQLRDDPLPLVPVLPQPAPTDFPLKRDV